jgi:hypothetical protein
VPEFHRTCCRIEPSLSLGHPCVGFNRTNISFALPEGKCTIGHACTRLRSPTADAILHAHDWSESSMNKQFVITVVNGTWGCCHG